MILVTVVRAGRASDSHTAHGAARVSTRIVTILLGWFSLSLLCGIAWIALLLLLDLIRNRRSAAGLSSPVPRCATGTASPPATPPETHTLLERAPPGGDDSTSVRRTPLIDEDMAA